MKPARILVLVLFLGFGLSVALHAWGQQPQSRDLAFPVDVQNGPLYLLAERHPDDAEMGKLVQEEATAEREVASLIESYAHTEGDRERSKIKSKVATALEKEFDLQQKRRDLELARVEARLKKVRELMKKRSEARQSIIDKRLDQLLREADGLGWTPPAGVNLRQHHGQLWQVK
jgi:hypothetical protein